MFSLTFTHFSVNNMSLSMLLGRVRVTTVFKQCKSFATIATKEQVVTNRRVEHNLQNRRRLDLINGDKVK